MTRVAVRDRLVADAPLWLLIALVCAVTLLGTFLPMGTQLVLTDALIKLIVVIGIYIFVGNSGVLSFGHIAFMGVGAYVGAWLAIPPDTKDLLLPELPVLLARVELPPWLGAIGAGSAAAAFAALVGMPLMRLGGIAASIGTFAVLAVVHAVLSNWTSMTGGQNSLYGMPPLLGPHAPLAWVVLAIAAAWFYQQSSPGFRLRASREDEHAALSVGVNIRRERLVAFVLGAFFVGAAGALYAQFLGVVVAREFYLKLSFITLAMLVIGGIRSLTGAVVGVLAVTVLSEILRYVERGIDLVVFSVPPRPGLQDTGLAVLMLVILLFRPRGITGGRELALPARFEHTDAAFSGRRKAALDTHGDTA